MHYCINAYICVLFVLKDFLWSHFLCVCVSVFTIICKTTAASQSALIKVLRLHQQTQHKNLNPNLHADTEPPDFPADLRAFKNLVSDFNQSSPVRMKTYLCCEKGHTFPSDDAPSHCSFTEATYAQINKDKRRANKRGGGRVCGREVTSKRVPQVLVVFSVADQLRLILEQEQHIETFKSYLGCMPPAEEALDNKVFCDVFDGLAFRDIHRSADMRNSVDDVSELHLYLQSGLDYGQIARWSVGKLGLQLYNVINLPRGRRFTRNRTYVECVFVFVVYQLCVIHIYI